MHAYIYTCTCQKFKHLWKTKAGPHQNTQKESIALSTCILVTKTLSQIQTFAKLLTETQFPCNMALARYVTLVISWNQPTIQTGHIQGSVTHCYFACHSYKLKTLSWAGNNHGVKGRGEEHHTRKGNEKLKDFSAKTKWTKSPFKPKLAATA